MPRCALKNCPYNQNGRCVENQLPDCPNLLPDQPSAEDTTDNVEPTGAEARPVAPLDESLYSGRKLTAEEAAQILQSTRAQIVVLGGMVESGKTTLLARIFEMFQSGEVAGYRFAESRTLVEFDKLSWHATMECGGAHPATEHTNRPENNLFLHLRIQAKDGSVPSIDFLIADIPGEIFPEAVAEESVLQDLCALRSAEHLVLFLDGGVLCDPAKRHDPYGKVFDFVSRALQTGQIGRHTILHLVTSKFDLLPVEAENEVLKFLEEAERTFQATFASRFGGVHSWRVAARPTHPGEQPTLSEISSLFGIWAIRALDNTDAFAKSPGRAGFHRDFCCFGL